jgi:hypothetical protein
MGREHAHSASHSHLQPLNTTQEKFWPFAPNPGHFVDCTRFLRTTGNRATRKCADRLGPKGRRPDSDSHIRSQRSVGGSEDPERIYCRAVSCRCASVTNRFFHFRRVGCFFQQVFYKAFTDLLRFANDRRGLTVIVQTYALAWRC